MKNETLTITETLGVFIDLSKVFDVVDHSILLKKLELYDKDETNKKWFGDYLTNQKFKYLSIFKFEYIQISDSQKRNL